MSWADSVASAIRAIGANKLRSILTMLGVVIGVGSVIAMIGIGEGTAQKSRENIELMGTNMLTVFPNWRRGGMSSSEAGALKDEDVLALKANVPTIDLITGIVRTSAPVKFGSHAKSTQVMGAEPQVAIIRNATKMLQGTWYTPQDEIDAARKVVLGYQVYDELFQGDNAIGANVKIKGQNFEVVGVIAYKGGSGMMSQDDQVYIPLKTAKTRLMGKTNLDQIVMKARYVDLMVYTQTMVEDTLYQKRRNAAGEELFRVMNQGEWLEQMETQTNLLRLLLAGIASVSLLVGGIGIMNIMLVSVTERTREIGIRRALGATGMDITWQFLVETVTLTSLGGLLGVALGLAGTSILQRATEWDAVVTPGAIALSFGVSALTGVLFGMYPARKAALMEPIAALRHE